LLRQWKNARWEGWDFQDLMNFKRCLQIGLEFPDSATIKAASTSSIPARNPYRAILRRDYPEPLIALLAFILGVWLWDHYFGKPAGYPPGTEEVALVKIDRDLRLADAMEDDPAWLRWLVGVDAPATVRRDGLLALQKLAADGSMSLPGLEAYAILRAVHDQQPLRETLAETMQGQMISGFVETSEKLASHRGAWWHARWIEAIEQDTPPACQWQEVHGADSRQLRTRALFARSWVWLLALAGVAFIPRTLVDLKRGLRAKPHGYGGAWPLPLGMVVFLVATLAWIGFTMTLELGISTLPGLHPLAGIMLDSAARMLPALIALGLLFRRPSHALRVMGLARPIHPQAILGVFALLIMIDLLLRAAIGGIDPSEPGGGLNAGDAGIWGLAFAVVSACLLAPLAEELLYRGVLFRSLWNRTGVLPAALLSSLVFAVLHFYNGYGLVSVGVFGLSCALLYAATGSLAACIGLHVLYNSAIKLPEWLIYHAALG
jgi:membrane protease YdiL (CAAX protease family)